MRIALINGGVVANIIEADSIEFAQSLGYDEAVEATDDAHLLGTYADGAFAPPPAPPAPPAPAPITTMTKLAFLRRFTAQERIAIRQAKATDPIIEDAESLMQLAEDIDVGDPDTVQYVGYLAQQGFITAERMTSILAPETI